MALWRDVVDRAVRAKARFGEPLALVIGPDMAERIQHELGPQSEGLEGLCRAFDIRLVVGPEGACLVLPAGQLEATECGAEATLAAPGPRP